jgi:hypothetical protein
MYSKIDKREVPKSERKVESRFEMTPEWAGMKADLARPLKNKEVLQIQLTEEEMTSYGITNHRTIVRFIVKYLAEKGLAYRVKSFHRADKLYIVVSGK